VDVTQIPAQSLSPAELAELKASMSRHPAGKQRVDLSRCPTCGTRPSGALGTAELSLSM
jgi:hypothetical protein